jgi:hypothetical protein
LVLVTALVEGKVEVSKEVCTKRDDVGYVVQATKG